MRGESVGNIKTRNIKSTLNEKGFEEKGGIKDKTRNPGRKQKRGSNHDLFCLYHNGRRQPVHVAISRGLSSYNDNLLSIVAKEMKLTKKECAKFYKCTISGTDYIEILKEKKVLKT